MKEFEDRIVAWAQQEENIRAVVVTGSRSRQDGTLDEWSDLDVQLIVTDYQKYIESDAWLDQIGTVWICLPEHSGGLPTRLTWFQGGKKVDFSFWPVEIVKRLVDQGQLSPEYQRGYYTILDKDGLIARLPPSPHITPAEEKPSAERFRFVVEEFWFEAIHVAQFIRRREPWVVKFRDWTMKEDLREILQWRAQTEHDWRANTWVIGKRIAQWTEPETWKTLYNIWGNFEPADSWRALLAELSLFHRVAAETAERLHYPYRKAVYDEILDYITTLYRDDPLRQ